MRPKVFVGSSSESIEIAYAVQDNLTHDAEITVWSQDVFDLTNSALNDLLNTLDKFDFGIFIFGGEDAVKIKNQEYSTTRDNVLFEFGLFLGKLGRERSFFITPRNQTGFHLPTDLLGVTPATFDLDTFQNNNVAALAPACNSIRRAIQRLGPIGNRYGLTLYSRVSDEAHFTKLLSDTRHELLTVGPTLLYVVQYLKDSLFTKAEKGVSVKILIMEEAEEPIRLLDNLTSPFDLKNSLKLCHQTLKDTWFEDIRAKQLKIQVKVTPLVPYSLTIIDGEHDTGRMLIIPAPYRTSGVDRPCILIEKRAYPEAFSRYYETTLAWWNASNSLQ